tara:strand:- start:2598 stop:2882 length:285 start_codon:yes stop_codon:yes gene_type:complete
MDVKVPYTNATNADEAFAIAKNQITGDYVDKFKVKTELSYDESAKKIIATGKGFTLTLAFGPSDCEVSLDLGFLYKPLKGKILETVQHKIKKHV